MGVSWAAFEWVAVNLTGPYASPVASSVTNITFDARIQSGANFLFFRPYRREFDEIRCCFVAQRPRDASRGRCVLLRSDQLTRFQVWPPQNMPPKAQP